MVLLCLIGQRNLPDLNRTVKRKMRDTRPNNADDLKAAIKATWASIPFHCLVFFSIVGDLGDTSKAVLTIGLGRARASRGPMIGCGVD